MQNLGHFISLGLGMAMIVEGLMYAIFPRQFQSMLRQVTQMLPDQLRWGGLLVALIGLAWVYFLRA